MTSDIKNYLQMPKKKKKKKKKKDLKVQKDVIMRRYNNEVS